ncbi:MAG: Thiol:disulfide oxidoreductase related to ResA [Polyangiaceae bacterium]|jgi:thiol-disulfide isomerase/thioredoxin|nr:Thiol:disulfide oxidoreductase related to ResA [Polyangiaceae bacterium]
MSLERAAVAAIAVLLAACAHSAPPERSKSASSRTAQNRPSESEAQLAHSAVNLQLLLRQIQGRPNDGRVPDFELESPAGARYSSRDLVGKKAFVAVFFATWCDYCESELRAVQLAFQQVGPLPIIPVSADGPETWARVPAYLAAFGIRDAPVRATDHREFFTAYNPSDSLPSLAIVGQSGALVDYIHGYDPAHAGRLLGSLRQAKSVAPLAWPSLDASNAP